ncbi:TPA: hypothetical protein EYN65_20155 [Candidatus Poribacteria bacterium]|nr:hypothetical protein [Candidatus Poribacteria bacterium]
MQDTNWLGFKYSTKSETNLHDTNLTKTDLFRANLIDTSLSNADLRGANLTRASLTRADLKGSLLHEAHCLTHTQMLRI